MKCSICGEDRAQSYIRRVDGKEVELTLCEGCYALHYPAQGNDFFASFVGSTETRRVAACPVCGTTLDDFRFTGLLGCADCYTAFREELLPTIRYVQGKVRHEGKAPSGDAEQKYDMIIGLVHKQEELRRRIKEAERVHDELAVRNLKAQLEEINRRLYGGEVT